MKDKRVTAEQFLDRILYIVKPDEFSSDTMDSDQPEDEEVSILNESSDDSQNTCNGFCIACKIRQCDIILMPCFHIVVCKQCWKENEAKHHETCEALYSKNKRKMEAEKKKVPCPCCDKIVEKWNEFHMAAIQS